VAHDRVLPEPLSDLVAVSVRQLDIQQNQIRYRGTILLQTFLPGPGRDDRAAGLLQQKPGEVSILLVVFDQ
jgi:hypothetical protein